MTAEGIESSSCTRTDIYPSKAAAKAALNAEAGRVNGPRRVVRCVLHSGASDAPVFHVVDAPAGRHRQAGRRDAQVVPSLDHE